MSLPYHPKLSRDAPVSPSSFETKDGVSIPADTQFRRQALKEYGLKPRRVFG